MRAPLLQRRHQRLAGISRVEAHGGLPAQMPLRPLQHLQHKLQPAVRRVDLPLAQPQVQDVARLPHRRHDRMIHAPVIVAVPRAARLFPVNLDRQAVDVDDQLLRTPPPAHRLQPPTRQPLQPLAQHLDAILRRPRRHPPRQRRLRGQAPAPAQRSRDSRTLDERRIRAFPAALPRQQQKRPAACPAENRTTLLRLSSSRPVRAPESPVIRSRRDPILIDLLKLNGASIIFTPGVMVGECWQFF